jgi:hypothetical protein
LFTNIGTIELIYNANAAHVQTMQRIYKYLGARYVLGRIYSVIKQFKTCFDPGLHEEKTR